MKKKLSFFLQLNIYLILLNISLLFLVFPVFCFAGENYPGFTLSPPIIEARVKPKSTFKFKIELLNQSPQPLLINAKIASFIPANNENTLRLDFTNQKYLSLFSFDGQKLPQKLYLDKNEIKDFYFSLSLPEKISEGDHNLAVVFETALADQSDFLFSSPQILQVVSLLLLTVSDKPLTENLNLDDFSLASPLFFSSPQNISVKITNNGRSKVKLSGTLKLSSLFPKSNYTITLPSQNLLSGSSMNLKGPAYHPLQTPLKLSPGFYRADMEVFSFAGSKPLLAKSFSFLYLPFSLFSLPLLFLLLFFLGHHYFK